MIRSSFFRSRRGNAILEAAMVLPILTSIAFGTIEYGDFFFVKHTLEGAAREGVRAAIVSTAVNADVNTAVANVMTAAGFSSGQYSITLSPTNVSGVAAGSNITITVSCTWSAVGIRPMSLISASKQVTGTAVMRRES
ncbi:MAG TPA: TadE/TadG family type IV pilus assembly protein [Tepidisphaeraceae bacterium]|jgi:Flp pilus assembly protein TadG|nr:TadE/TadG family type IV pilus assembly protein [Tepidisphaeraceae bacterium]